MMKALHFPKAASGCNPPAGGSEVRGQRSKVSRTTSSILSSVAPREGTRTLGDSATIYAKNIDVSDKGSHAAPQTNLCRDRA